MVTPVKGKPVKEYRIKIHLFGAVSSPGCANFGLKRAAGDGEFEFSEAAAYFVRNNFYVAYISVVQLQAQG